jgi:DNA-binding MarR family transcriptional regulator
VSSLRGCYLGSNVTYNVKKMVKKGDLTQQRSLNDGRVIRIGLTEKGIRLRDRLTTMHQPFVLSQPNVGVVYGLRTRAAAMIGRWTAYEKSRSACPSMLRADCLLKLPSWYLQPGTMASR